MKELEELTRGDLLAAFEIVFDCGDSDLAKAFNEAYVNSISNRVEVEKKEKYEKKIKAYKDNVFKAQRKHDRNGTPATQKSLNNAEKALATFLEEYSTFEKFPLPELSPSTVGAHISQGKPNANSDFLSARAFGDVWEILHRSRDDSCSWEERSASLFKTLKDIGHKKLEDRDHMYNVSSYERRYSEKTLEADGETSFVSVVIKHACSKKRKSPPPASKDTLIEKNKPAKTPSIIPATYMDLLNHGWTKETIAKALVEGDYETCNEIDPENEGSAEQWQVFLSECPESFQYLVTEDFRQIAGNFSFVSLYDEDVALALEGRLYESKLSPDKTRDLSGPATDHVMFLLNLSLRHPFGATKDILLLRKMFLSQLLEYAENGIFFKKIIAVAHRRTGESFLLSWGFKFVTSHEKTGKIYVIDMLPFPDMLDRALKQYSGINPIREKLKSLYNQVPIVFDDEENEKESFQFASSECGDVEGFIQLLDDPYMERRCRENAGYMLKFFGKSQVFSFLTRYTKAFMVSRATFVTRMKQIQQLLGDDWPQTLWSLYCEDESSLLDSVGSLVESEWGNAIKSYDKKRKAKLHNRYIEL